MTLAPGRLLGARLVPMRDEDVVVVEELAPWCYAPGCVYAPEPGAHHIEPRSRTGGPRIAVSIDGLVISNLARLCPVHHLAVTGGVGGHTARIVWHEQPLGHWCWLERLTPEPGCAVLPGPGWRCVGPLRSPLTPEVCDGSCAL